MVSSKYLTSCGLRSSSFSMIGIRGFLSSPSLWRNYREALIPSIPQPINLYETLTLRTTFFRYSMLDTPFSLC